MRSRPCEAARPQHFMSVITSKVFYRDRRYVTLVDLVTMNLIFSELQ